MSDPFSITASILAVVGAGLKVAKGLHQLANGLGSAGIEVRVYADEIDAFSKLLHRVREHLLQEQGTTFQDERTLLRDIVDICERVIDPIKSIQERLNPLLVHFRQCPNKLKSFTLRIQWMFRSKEKLLFYRGALKGQHRLLDTTLALMVLRSCKDRTAQTVEILQISLENSVVGIKNSLSDSKSLISGEASVTGTLQIGLPVTHSAWRNTSGATFAVLAPTSPSSEGSAGSQFDSQLTSPTGTISSDESAPDTSPWTLSARPDAGGNLYQGRIIGEQELEEQFDESAQDLWEDMRVVSRKLLRHVSDVLRESQASTSRHTTPEPQMNNPISLPDTGRQKQWGHLQKSLETNHRPLPEDQIPHEANQGHLSAGTWNYSPASHNNMPEIAKNDEQYLSFQTTGPTMAVGSMRAPAIPEDVIPTVNAEASVAVGANRSYVPNRTVTFKNADGSLWGLPFDEIQEWENMHAFLTELYPRTSLMCLFSEITFSELYPEVGDTGAVLGAFYRNEYDLIGPHGQRLLPQLWNRVIQPGWIIELRFHNAEFNVDLPELERLDVEFYVDLPELERTEVKARLNRQYERARQDLEKRRLEAQELEVGQASVLKVKHGREGVLRVFKGEEA